MYIALPENLKDCIRFAIIHLETDVKYWTKSVISEVMSPGYFHLRDYPALELGRLLGDICA